MDGLELCFSSLDFRPELDAVEEVVINSNMQVELIFGIEFFPQGRGFRTLSDEWSEDERITESATMEGNNEVIGKNLDAEITLIIGRKNNDKTDVLCSYLNGVKRKMTVDSGAASSFILNTEDPRKSRLFRITKIEKYYLHDQHESPYSRWPNEKDENENDNGDSMDYNTSTALDTQGWIEPPMDELELKFCSRDIWIELKRNEDIVYVSNVQIELIFTIRVFPPGTGYNTFLDSSTTTTHYSEDGSRELIAKVSLVIGKADNGDAEVVYSYLNGIRRRMTVDLEAITSVIYNTDCPWKSRRFTIEYVEKNILYNCHNTVDTFMPDDHDNNDGILKPDEEEDQEDNIDLKHAEKVELYDYHDDFDIYKSDDEVNHGDINGTNNEPKEVEQDEEFSTENSFGTSSKFHSDFPKAIQEKEEKNVRNIQGTERLEVNQSHSPDISESDDPRKGGKVKTENDEDNKDR